MPMYMDELEQAGPRVSLHASLAVEIDWALSGAHRAQKALPALQRFYQEYPDLATEVRQLWAPEEALTYPGYLELSLLAFAGGLLFSTDSAAFLARLDEMCQTSPKELPLMSELPADRERLLQRLEVLRSSSRRRVHYVQVVSAVWSHLRPLWEAQGQAAVELAILERSMVLDKIRTWEELLEPHCAVDLGALVDALGEDDELAVVPAYFNCKRGFFDVPGFVVLSVRTDSPAAIARARTDLLARRLKAISDPTRLAMLDTLARHEMRITDIAKMFSLSQPTVSNHVKVLRSAGFLAQGSGRGKRQLAVRRDVVENVVSDLQKVLDPAAAPR
ncbi:MAG TPA: metalloregulator ArsR/SmtB family transcription factor [Acidimicrobiales bacterium]|nr:metalloregulator ArsR/SmtB family transcription factor [Acidimicrobiales bacterium]